VDEGSGFEDGNVLIYDATFDVWVPGEPAVNASINYEPLEFVAAGMSGSDIVLDVDNGNNFSFSRTLLGNETLLPPSNMPEGSVLSFLANTENVSTTAPVVQARNSGRTTGNATSHPITLPSGIVAGELLLVVFSCDGTPTILPPSDWSLLGQASNGTVVTGAFLWKIAEGSDTLTITTSLLQESSHISFRISGVFVPGTVEGSSANGSSTNSNPPSHSMSLLGSRGRLWIATRSGDSTVVATAAPADYTDLQTQAANTSGGASTNTAERTITGSSETEDPGVFTSTSEQWVSWTIGIDSSGFHVLSFDGEFSSSTPVVRGESLLQIQKLGATRYIAVEGWALS
jgi:hypothetical protein